MKLQQFNAGVSSRLAPQLIAPNEGVVYENIDNATAVLTPLKDKLETNIEVDKFSKYFVAENKWLSSPKQTDYLEFQKVMYSANRVNRPEKYSKGVTNFLGIEKPKAKSTISVINKATPLEELTVLNKSDAGDLPASDLTYLLFNENNGYYSAPFKFVVYASITEATRAQGSVTAYDEDARYNVNTITTEEDPANRSVQFSKLKGEFANSAKLFRYYDGAWRLVGTFTNKTDVILDQVNDIGANQELDPTIISPFNGIYQYVYTFYNANDGTESAPSPVSSEIEINSGVAKVILASTSSDPQVTHKRLYRVGGLLTEFTMVAQLNKNVTEYTDSLPINDIDGRLLESDNYYEAPAGLKYLVESYAMLFGALGSSLRFTPIGKPNAWPPEYEIQFDQDITGIGPVANGLLVFTKAKTFIVTGTGPTTLSQQSLRGDQGCISFESIQEAIAGTVVWASEDGLCSSSGNNVVSLTKDKLGKITLDPVNAVVNDETYYCHNKDGSTLAWDYRFQPILKWLKLDVSNLVTANGTLYGHCEGKLNILYKGTNNLEFKYKTPLFTEGSFSENKTYKKVYVRSEGDIIIKILIDSKEVASFNLSGVATHQLQVPQQFQRGYSIQFEISGTGVVNELEYTVGPRQND